MEILDKAISKIVVKELPQMRVATYRVISTKPEKDSANRLKKIVESNGLLFNELIRYGIDVPISSKNLYKGLRGYECWVCIPESVIELDGSIIKTIPKNRYAVIRIKMPVKDHIEVISSSWLELQEWIRMKGYNTALHNPNRYMLESQVEIKGVSYLELYYPL